MLLVLFRKLQESYKKSMSQYDQYDTVIIGAGSNGLAAAITLARAGQRVLVLEQHEQVGGTMQSQALTLPDFVHDVGSAIYPMGRASPAFRLWPLHAFGLRWIDSPLVFAHPLENHDVVVVHRSLERTAHELAEDGPMYRRLIGPLLPHSQELMREILRPVLRFPNVKALAPYARFGSVGLLSAAALIRCFRTKRARALLAGLAAHTGLPLTAAGTAAPTLTLALLGHAVGWPFPAGGASALAQSMRAYLEYLGGEVCTGIQINRPEDLPRSRSLIVNSSPAVLLKLFGDRAPSSYRQTLERFRYGAGMQKLDYALSRPVPWLNDRVKKSATVHLGGTYEEIARSEDTLSGESPYLIVAQHSLFDTSRAPSGQHTLWVYGHVKNGSADDIRPAIEAQIERYAPNFRDCVLACRQTTAPMLEAFTSVCRGGDVGGGAVDLTQLIARPVWSSTPYRTPIKGVYLASSSAAPGGGVHGMAGYWAAQAVLADVRHDLLP